jgi:NADH-quinone oxidoreductase subunit G
MSTETAAPVQMLNVQIDGVWMQFPKGTRVIEACEKAGKFVPHYCYHPKLSSPGNCRMCLIEMGMPKMGPDRKPVIGPDGKAEIGWIPRPQISCAQDIAEGMGVRTDSPMVKECRQGVMEFLLINHPLDCPICDQAGECNLQEYSVEYGNGKSRFLEHKVKKPKNVEVGPRVTLDAERCVLCSRCIRFMKEVAHDDVLGFVDRGSHSTIACHPDRTLDSNYSLNTVDICPVGALTSTDFRFKMRVWFLKETKSFCTSCATGCNTIIGSRENIVYRQTPRENNDVNSVWMCDHGRLNFHFLNSPDRLTNPTVKGAGGNEVARWDLALSRATSELKKFKGDEVAIIASGSATNEELFLIRKLADKVGTTLIDVIPHNATGDKILLSADRNANTAGARLMRVTGGVPGSLLGLMSTGLRNKTIKALVVLGEDATSVLGEEIAHAQLIIAMNTNPNGTTKLAHVVLPSSGFAEKRGSMINKNSRLQRLNRAVQAPGGAQDDWEILRDLVQGVSGENGIYAIEDLFKQLAAAIPTFAGLSLSKIGDLGVQLNIESAENSEPPKTSSPTATTPT